MVPLSGSLHVASLTPPAHEKALCLVSPRFTLLPLLLTFHISVYVEYISLSHTDTVH